MFTVVLASMMILAAGSADKIAGPRDTYSKCIKAFLTSNAEKKVEQSALETALATACAAEEASFRNAIIAQQLSMKAPRKDAEQAATDWVTDLKANAKETYRDMTGQTGSGT
jgi:hypothetical protein